MDNQKYGSIQKTPIITARLPKLRRWNILMYRLVYNAQSPLETINTKPDRHIRVIFWDNIQFSMQPLHFVPNTQILNCISATQLGAKCLARFVDYEGKLFDLNLMRKSDNFPIFQHCRINLLLTNIYLSKTLPGAKM